MYQQTHIAHCTAGNGGAGQMGGNGFAGVNGVDGAARECNVGTHYSTIICSIPGWPSDWTELWFRVSWMGGLEGAQPFNSGAVRRGPEGEAYNCVGVGLGTPEHLKRTLPPSPLKGNNGQPGGNGGNGGRTGRHGAGGDSWLKIVMGFTEDYRMEIATWEGQRRGEWAGDGGSAARRACSCRGAGKLAGGCNQRQLGPSPVCMRRAVGGLGGVPTGQVASGGAPGIGGESQGSDASANAPQAE
jgi:hypothetical protein